MPGIGTIVNTIAVIIGGTTGLLLKKGMPERYQEMLYNALGACTMLIGISGSLAGMFRLKPDGTLDRVDILVLIFSMVIGGMIGEFFKLKERFDAFAAKVQSKFSSNTKDNSFAQGFVSATVLFCVGAMTIVGAIEDGLMGNPETLFAKSVLDGVISVVFASIYGIGVVFSAAAVFVYQGLLTLFSFALRPLVTDAVMLQTSLVGSAVIMLIGINMMGLKKINVISFIPATFIPLIWAAIQMIVPFAR